MPAYAITHPLESEQRDVYFHNPEALLDLFPSYEMTNGYYRVFREYTTGAGRCDLLLVWEGGAAIIEFKRQRADESAVAQCLRYCGAIYAKLGFKPESVVAAPEFTDNALSAALGSGTICVTTDADASAFAIQSGRWLRYQYGSTDPVFLTHCFGSDA